MDNQIQADLLERARAEILEDFPTSEIVSFKHLEGSVMVFFIEPVEDFFWGKGHIHHVRHISKNGEYDWLEETGISYPDNGENNES